MGSTAEGDDMTEQHIYERLAALHYSMLMMRLGVRQKA
jgi:hypothetical protein